MLRFSKHPGQGSADSEVHVLFSSKLKSATMSFLQIGMRKLVRGLMTCWEVQPKFRGHGLGVWEVDTARAGGGGCACFVSTLCRVRCCTDVRILPALSRGRVTGARCTLCWGADMQR